jgi:phosphoglycolate phosphatase-like HAD superfamily hydrolase
MKKTVLITDLDNTLFDWVDLWYHCFSSMLDQIVSISGVDRAQLKTEIRAVHQKHGTSEYSLLIEELPSIQKKFAGQEIMEIFAPAIVAYRTQRRKYLRLYPTVAETLLLIKGRGTKIVAYTESMGFYSNYRLRRLGLDGVIDIVFSPQDHDLPEGMSPEQIRKYPATHYDLKYTAHEHTPKGSTKPDAAVLDAIIVGLRLSKANCIPALRAMAERPNGYVSTSELITELEAEFRPTGEDAKILDNRHDTKFSQVVRNLKSHQNNSTSFVVNGYAEVVDDGFRITPAGRKYLAQLPE